MTPRSARSRITRCAAELARASYDDCVSDADADMMRAIAVEAREAGDYLCAEVDRLRSDVEFRVVRSERDDLAARAVALHRALRKLLLSRDVSWTGGHDWEVAVADAIEVLDAAREESS